MDALRGMLAADVSVHADGGGKRPAATEPVVGARCRYETSKVSGGLVP